MGQTGTISAAIEPAVHRALADAAQRIFDEFGIQVNSAEFNWMNLDTSSESRRDCIEVHLRTSMAAGINSRSRT